MEYPVKVMNRHSAKKVGKNQKQKTHWVAIIVTEKVQFLNLTILTEIMRTP